MENCIESNFTGNISGIKILDLLILSVGMDKRLNLFSYLVIIGPLD